MHYVISDLHGQFAWFIAMLTEIEFKKSDTLYFLGDAIDRGPDSILLLSYILKHKNMVFLMGNHEWMMYRSIVWNDHLQQYVWMENGGKKTWDEFDALSRHEKRWTIKKLEKSYLVIPNLEVNGRHFYLSHATHLPFYTKEPLRLKDIERKYKREDVIKIGENLLWSREYQDPNPEWLYWKYKELYQSYPKDTTLIVGHNMVHKTSFGIETRDKKDRISSTRHGHLINIDCGCAAKRKPGCLRLEDMKEFYIDKHKI